MADAISVGDLFDFTVEGRLRVITYLRTTNISEGVDSDVYNFVDDKKHELAIYTVRRSIKTQPRKIAPGRHVVVGYLQGKGTLTVNLPDGTKDTYYFETDGHVKEVTVHQDQILQWRATNDADLVCYEMRDAPAAPPKPAPAPAAAPAAKPAAAKGMKLFLTSASLSDAHNPEFSKLVGRAPRDTQLALIENAADLETGKPAWVAQNREALKGHGYKVEVIDLKPYLHDPIDLLQRLQKKHAIWFGGGNVFYLRWLLHETRADELLKKLVNRGLVYAGGSAGAIVAGPTLQHFETADDTSQVKEVIWEGLGLTDSVVVPHMDNDAYGQIVKKINQELLHDKFKTVPLKESQALIITGGSQRVI